MARGDHRQGRRLRRVRRLEMKHRVRSAEELQRHVFEGECRAMKKLHDRQVTHLNKGCDLRIIKRAVTCLDQLPERSLAVIRARYNQQLSVSDVADSHEMEPNAVRQLLHRSRLNLRRCIQQQVAW